jgi:nonsense-mediated mRNA decay protein 3
MAMELDTSVPLEPSTKVSATILCCNCGAPIDGTKAAGALCNDCIKLTVDISEGIQREATLHFCRDCDRWLSPPNQWLVATPESRELLALCLRKLRGLSKTRIIDASFIWTEPHSKRIKIKITIQQEAFQGTILQQAFEVEYIVAYTQCPDCAKSYTHNTWRAVVQVRQHVPHKRTFLYLEQLILKHSAHKDTINIKEVSDGIDFFFSARNHAEKFVDFLSSVVPVQMKKSQELISMDIHTSTKSYKFSFSVKLVPICKDDLVALPIKLAKQLGNIAPLTLCYRVGTSVNLLDTHTLQTTDVSTAQYWHTPFSPLADVQDLVEFVVLDIDPIGDSNVTTVKGRFLLAEATVARASDLGVNDTSYYVRTHLGAILHPGDSVMGYMLTGTNFNNPQFEALEEHKNYSRTIPDVVLVKKHYPRKKKNKARNWRVKRMDKEESDMAARKQDADRLERDFEMFLRDVEEDTELRNALSLYKKKGRQAEPADGMDVDEDSEPEDEGLRIPMEQLLDDFEEMGLHESE